MNSKQNPGWSLLEQVDKTLLLIITLIICSTFHNTYSGSTDTLSMFRGGPQRTGYFGEQGVIDSPVVKWKFKTNGKIYSSPIIYNEVVFFGSGDSCLYAVDENNGTLKWKFKTEGKVNSSPAIYKGTVFFGSMDGYFYSLNAEDGSLKWKFQTEGEKLFSRLNLFGFKFNKPLDDVYDFFLSSPLVFDGKVYFGSGDGHLYALDILTGNKVWAFKANDIIHTSPALYNGNIFFGSMDHYFYALDGKTGNLLWKYATGADASLWMMTGIISSAAVKDDVLYFGARDANMFGLNVSDGSRKWIFSNSGSWVLTSPAVHNGRVYFGTSDTRLLRAFNIESKKMNFSTSCQGYVYSSPAISSDMVYVGCYNGVFCSLNAVTGKLNWTFETDGHKSDIYDVLDDKGNIKPNLIDYSTIETYYKTVETLRSCGTIVSSPCISKGDVYFGSADGNLYALTEAKQTGIGEIRTEILNFELNQNYPNPFNPETIIRYQLPEFRHVELKVYDVLGKEVKILVDKEQAYGKYEVHFDASGLSSGMYFYRLETDNLSSTRKMILLR